jgi:hypothetical protein
VLVGLVVLVEVGYPSNSLGIPRGQGVNMESVAGQWQDAVPRRQEFERKHPEYTIKYVRGVWYASHTETGITFMSELRGLGSLIDRLEILTGERA